MFTVDVKQQYNNNNTTKQELDALAEEEQELEALIESLDKTCTRYKMEISAEKTKLMTTAPIASREG